MNINLTLFGQTIAFIVFVWFCMKFIWPHLMKALHDRQQKIADGLAAAEEGHRQLEEAEQRAGHAIEEARAKANEMINQAQKRAEEIVEEAKAQARGDGERIVAAARADIDNEINQAREALRHQVGALAVAGAEQILLREVDANAHREVLDKLSTEL
jgi:F-type H+-transporting ATPase subunit b